MVKNVIWAGKLETDIFNKEKQAKYAIWSQIFHY